MSNLTVTDDFLIEGGSEAAPMSTTSDLDIALGLRVSCAVNEARHVLRLSIYERWCFSRKPHVAGKRIAQRVLHVPQLPLLLVIDPPAQNKNVSFCPMSC